MAVMNAVEARPFHEALGRDMSTLRTMGDIYYKFSLGDKTVTLDFRPMSAIKFTAVALLENTTSTEVVTDLNRAIELFASALKLNYGHAIIHIQKFDTFYLDIQLNDDILDVVSSFMHDLRHWLLLAEINLASQRT